MSTFSGSGFQPLESRILLSSQIITVDPVIPIAVPDGQVAVNVTYDSMNNAGNPDPTLSSLLLRMHFDSTQLTLEADSSLVSRNDKLQSRVDVGDLTGVLGGSAFADFGGAGINADTTDLDNDPSTDMYLNIAWFDLSGAWPGSTPISLFTANFSATSGFSGTTINFTSDSPSTTETASDGDTTEDNEQFELAAESVFIATPLMADVIDVSPDPRGGGINEIQVVFDREVENVDLADFTLTRSGGSDLLAGAGNLSVNSADNITYTISGQGLFDLTDQNGNYVFTVQSGAGISDLGGNDLAANASDAFEVDTSAPQISTVVLNEDAGESDSDLLTNDTDPQVIVTFTQPVFGDAGDITVTGPGGAVNFVADGFGTNTLLIGIPSAPAGNYTVTLDGSATGLLNENNLPLANGDEQINFTVETTAPTADITDVQPDPRNVSVSSIVVEFDEPVFGVDLDDFALTLNGNPVSLAGAAVTPDNDNDTFTISGLSTLTSADGDYVLTLSAAASGIMDIAGNALAGDASDAFTVDATRPQATITAVTPDPRTTSVAEIAFALNENVTGADISDFTLTRNGAAVSLAGASVVQDTAASYRIVGLSGITGTDGEYVITLASSATGIVDAAGNVALGDDDAFTVDSTGPTVVEVTPAGIVSTPVTTIQVTFADASAIDASTAIDSGNYQLLAADGDGEFINDSTDISNLIQSISFNATGNVATITLSPAAGAGLVQDVEDFRLVISGVTDELGNELNGGTPVAAEFQIDTTIPIVTVNTLTTTDNTPDITGTIDDVDSTIVVTVNGVMYNATNNGDSTWTVPGSSIQFIPDGVYNVSVVATDNLGKIGTDASDDELTILDIFEPDGSTALADVRPAGPLPTDGTTEEHSLHQSNDVDFVPFTIAAQDLFVISLDSPAGTDVRLGLYDASGNLVTNIVDSDANGDVEIERTLAPGDYYLGIFSLVEDSVPSYTVSVASLPDLTVDIVSVDSSVSPFFGGSGNVDVEITNERGREADGNVQVQIFVSSDDTFDGSDTLVGTGSVSLSNLLPGTSTFGEVEINLPQGMSAGNYFLFASVDTAQAVAEINENNNESDPFAQAIGEIVAAFGGRDIARVTDADGTNIAARLVGGGSALIIADGQGNLDVVAEGTTERSSLIITNDRMGDGEADIDELFVDGPLRTLNGPRLAASGDVVINGGVTFFNVLKTGDTNVTIDGSAGQIRIGSATGTQLDVNGGVRLLHNSEWIGGEINADSIGTLLVVPNLRDVFNRGFDAEVNLSGDGSDNNVLGRAVVRTNIFNSTWGLAGGAGPINALDASNWTINVDGPVASLLLRQAFDVELTADGSVNLIRAATWDQGFIDVETLRVLSIIGDFNADLDVRGPNSAPLPAINLIRIGGDVNGGEWTLDSVNNILIRGNATGWDLQVDDGDVRMIRTGVLTNSDILLDGGGLWNGVFTQVNNSDIEAGFARVLRTTGDRFLPGNWSGDIDLGQNANGVSTYLLFVRGTFMADYRASGDLNAATLGATDGATIFLGVNGPSSVLPDSGSDFFNQATLRTLNVTGNAPGNNGPAFVDTRVAAWNLGQAILRSVETDNGGDPFGFAADNARLINRLDDGLLRNVDDPANPLIDFFGDDDFVVRIVDDVMTT